MSTEKSNIKDLIQGVDEKFQNLDAKIISKVESMNNRYNNDIEKINKILKSEETYENGLNESRGEMLKLIYSKRDDDLKLLTEFMELDQQNKLENLKILSDSIKSKDLSFSKSLIPIREYILYQTRHDKHLSVSQLFKYSKFLQNEKKHNLENVQKVYPLFQITNIYKLASGLIFLCGYNEQKRVCMI